MEYKKPALAISDQVKKLKSRGLLGDENSIANHLSSVSYARLERYWIPFQASSKQFAPDTTIEKIWDRYVFDRRLRLLTLDVIERIEIFIRTRLALVHSTSYGPFSYAEDDKSLPGLEPKRHKKFRSYLLMQFERSEEDFVMDFKAQHGKSHKFLPVWLAIEIMSFGNVLTFYEGCNFDIRRAIASDFKVHHTALENWIRAINVLRNICAHHGRLWNRVFGVKPIIPEIRNDVRWHKPIAISNKEIFGILTVCKHCIDCVAPQSKWPIRVRKLIADSPHIPINEMGFPSDWHTCPIWSP